MLVQRLRHWPTFGECAVLAGKALAVNMLEVKSLFPDRHGNTTFCVTTQSSHERNGELFPHKCRSSI